MDLREAAFAGEKPIDLKVKVKPVFGFLVHHDAVDYFHKAVDFGNHSAMVYGDYTRQLQKLGKLMNIDVIEA